MRIFLKRVLIFVGCVALLIAAWAMRIASLNPSRWYMYWSDRREVAQISFYGRVVDEKGNAVAGATVEVRIRSYNPWYLFGGHRGTSMHLKRHTGADGTFEVKGYRGLDLGIERVSKPGYEWLHETQTSEFRGQWPTQNRGYSYRPTSFRYVPDQANPAIFPLLMPGAQPAVWPSRGGWDQNPDGTRARNGSIQPRQPSIALPAGH